RPPALGRGPGGGLPSSPGRKAGRRRLVGGVTAVGMNLREALDVVAQHRGQRIVIPTMASVAVWPQLSDTPLDFSYMPSAMSQGPALGLGLALAQPEHGAIVLNGDGSMLMNLGNLVTLANYPANVFVLIIDNGLYEVTGGQATA